jgi:hypothetical protein
MKQLKCIIWETGDAEVRLSNLRSEEDRWPPKSAEGIFPSTKFLFARRAQ